MEKINIAELLKNCPKGMELDCTICNNPVVLEDVIEDNNPYPIRVASKDFHHYLTKYGGLYEYEDAKCVIFPKGKTTWEGFMPPCKFKNGDVLVSETGNIVLLSHIDSKCRVNYHCIIPTYDNFRIAENTSIGVGKYYDCVLANEQQRQRMYDKIKSSGYKYNQNTNKLEKLVEPKFKDGDIVYVEDAGGIHHIIIFKKLNSGLHRYANLSDDQYLYIDESTVCSKSKISKIRLATEEEKAELFQAIKAHGYKWNPKTKTLEKLIEPKFKVGDRIKDKNNFTYTVLSAECWGYMLDDIYRTCVAFRDQDNYELVPNKFDITTLVPFESEVLVRNSDSGFWKPAFWGIYEAEKSNEHQYRNYLTTEGFVRHCIPYNNETKHLLGKTYDCDEFYKTWEE